ncbi:MAG: AAA family ATPase [Agathobacter sp.]|nr:AAA family ATPase [Agathobacter sp.]
MGKLNNLGFTQKDEERNLAEIIEIAEKNLNDAKESIRKMGDDISDLFDSIDMRDKEGLILWNDANIRLKEMKRNMDRFEKARRKPYFGRIKFKEEGSSKEEAYYVGRVGITNGKANPVVIDWRAPIASVYYENNLGKCQYTVSSEGNYEIDLLRKRTYEIENDKLKDYFDSDVVANDELLTKYLAKNKKAVLGEIIATIQKEQNLIIRRSPKTNIIVQGCAGSGKTTVAMHRISYILYNYEEDFRPEDFYIIGSNKILLNYITSVLPELDVYGVSQMTMEELFVRLLYEDWDLNYQIKPLDKNDEVNCIKGNEQWFRNLENFCLRYENEHIPRKNIYMDKTNTLLIGENLIDTYCKDNSKMSMQNKCIMLNKILLSKYENEIQGKNISFTDAEKKEMEKRYSGYFGKDKWKGSIYDLYNEFLQEQIQKGHEVTIPDKSYDVYDLAALAYIYKRIKEIDPIREASHVVIDEAQDFGMMAYYCMHYCLR